MSKETITSRVCKAKAEISKVAKNNRNNFAKYDYVSVDDMYDAVRDIMAKYELDLVVSEHTQEIREVSSDSRSKLWLLVTYTIGLVGEEPQKRSIAMPATGAQTFEAAISYVCKQWIRQRFQIPTGEVDVDDTDPKETKPPKAVAKKKAMVTPPELPDGVETSPVATELDDKLTKEHVSWLRKWAREYAEVRDMLKDKLPANMTQANYEEARRFVLAAETGDGADLY